MNCINCGTANDDGAVFCSNCGKSPNAVVRNHQSGGSGSGGYPLSNFTAKSFSVLFEIVLWVILIGGFIGGGILADAIARTDGGVFLGIIIGGLVGFITIILTGGLVSMFIKLVNNSDEIKKQLKDMQKQP